MGIMTRMLRLCKADVHGVMDQLEDKGLLLKQHLREMEARLQEKEARLARLAHVCRKGQQDMANCSEEINRVEKDLNLAVVKEKDEIARMLIRKRWALQMAFDRLNRQINILNEEKQQLTETLDRQRIQYETLKTRATSFCNPSDPYPLEDSDVIMDWTGAKQGLSNEEIELELLQRKEKMQKGGTP